MRKRFPTNQLIVLLLTTSLALVMTTGGSALAATDSGTTSPSADAGGLDLSLLETRFFEHTYPKDSTDQRLERLEKMVFGEVRPGNDQQRLANLMAAVPADVALPSDSSAVQSPNPSKQNATPTASNGADDNTADSSDYPSVTALETEIMGASYPQKPITNRLAALETKAFGKVSSSNDLSDRVALLQSYAAEHDLVPSPGDNSTAANPGFQPSAPTTRTAPSANMPLEAKVAWLEQQVYGSASTGKPLINRVKRLDKTLLPDEHLDTTESLPENVNTLLNSYQISHNPTGPKAAGIQYANKPAYNPPSYGYSTPSTYGQPAAQPSQAPTDPYGSAASQPYAPPTQYQAQTSPYQPPAYQSYQPQANPYQPQPYSTQTDPNQQPAYGYQSTNTNTNTQSAPTQHHSLIHGLAKVLGAVGSMAAGSMGGMGGFGGYGMGYGGYGGGMPGMGYGGYGMPGMGYGGMPGVGYGGYPGMGYGGGFPGMHF